MERPMPRKRFTDSEGREITEWYETPAIEPKGDPPAHLGTPSEHGGMTPELSKWYGDRNKGRNTKWRNGMTKQEVQVRLSEAQKLIDPTVNAKFLPEDVQQRTGIEINPLNYLELLLRSGTLTIKEQLACASTIVQYTHSKAPTITHSTKTEMTPEDWLLQIEDQYPVVTVEDQRAKRVPDGQGKNNKWLKGNVSRDRMKAAKLRGSEGDHLAIEGESIDIDDPRRVVGREEGEGS